jgi:hypothetical protein
LTTKDQIRSFARSMLKVVAISRPSRIAALLVHLLLERGELLLVDEHAEFAGLGEVHHRREEGRRLDAAVATLGRHVRQRAGEQRAAEAVADDVAVLLAGRFSIASSAARGPSRM